MRTHVYYDTNIFTIQTRGGISTYFAELFQQFRRQPSLAVRPHVLPGLVSARQLDIRGPLVRPPEILRRPPRMLRVNQRLSRPALALARVVRRVDVYHSTFYDTPLPDLGGLRRVATVHDMIPELFPEEFVGGNPHALKEEHVRGSDTVICVSESTRADLQRVYGAVKATIVVIPLAAARRYRQISRPDDFGHYILYVGQRAGYKNFVTFARACAELSASGITGVVVGSPLTPEEAMWLSEVGVLTSLRVVSASNDELHHLYSRAIAFVYPSRYEGFGIPVIEAMASGCPCLLAATPALQEVADDAAVYFAPQDHLAIASAARVLRDDPVRRSRLIESGLVRAGSFSWSRTASATAQIYKE